MFREWRKSVCLTLKIVDILIGLIVIGSTLFLIFYWKYIPDQVPLHWNFAGEIDDYTEAGSYTILLMMMYIFYIWHQFTKLIPWFGWKETFFGKEHLEQVSKELEYKAINTLMGMLWCCDLLLQIMLAYLIICGVFVRNLGAWYLIALFVLLTIDFVWFGIQSIRIKNQVNQ